MSPLTLKKSRASKGSVSKASLDRRRQERMCSGDALATPHFAHTGKTLLPWLKEQLLSFYFDMANKDDDKNKDDPKDIKSIFEKYTEAAGNQGKLLLEDAKKWFEEANIIGKKPGKTESEFDESFAKVAKDKASMTYEEFKSYIQTLAKDVKLEANELIDKLVASQEDKTEDSEEKTEKAGDKTKKAKDKTEKK
ncbi:hypothetical protein AVEN_63713-1 [Araneus ventricosus]|uniref:TPPP family protein CG45057 n=1 Tax=Araneus ventricosus TaxID=182803 RepID=A0A4Y2L6S3_ARAVE|nr:hypothetical protein AVEN_63713-1 [Araneus ventricosus]